MKPTVFSVTSLDQIETHIQSARQDGITPTLAIVFSSFVDNLKEVGAAFAKSDIQVFGASVHPGATRRDLYRGRYQ